jgi:hypothetical protein
MVEGKKREYTSQFILRLNAALIDRAALVARAPDG